MTKFRVITANLCSVDQPRRIEAIADKLAQHSPNVVVIQEAVDPETLLTLLSARLGHCATSLYFNNNRKNPDHDEHLMIAVFGDGVTPVEAKIVPRPSEFAGSRQLGRLSMLKPRTTGRIDLRFQEGFTVHGVHNDWAGLSTLWHTTHRVRQTRQLLEDMSGPSIIAGDFNNGLGSPSIGMLARDPRIVGRAVDHPTWPAEPDSFWQNNLLGPWSTIARWPERKSGTVLPNGELPRATIDNIFHTTGFISSAQAVVRLPGSDHLGVVADYELVA